MCQKKSFTKSIQFHRLFLDFPEKKTNSKKFPPQFARKKWAKGLKNAASGDVKSTVFVHRSWHLLAQELRTGHLRALLRAMQQRPHEGQRRQVRWYRRFSRLEVHIFLRDLNNFWGPGIVETSLPSENFAFGKTMDVKGLRQWTISRLK